MRILSKFWVASLANFLLIFVSNALSVENNFYKPTVNANTPITQSYGCKRPNWGEKQYFVNLDNNKQVECLLNTRNYVLLTSMRDVSISIKQCKRGKKMHNCCKVVKGIFVSKNNVEITLDKSNLQAVSVDHVLPWAYIRLNMQSCKFTSKYYNYLPNLVLIPHTENATKSDHVCQTEEECIQQREICHKMADEFNDKRLCEEIDNFYKNNTHDNLQK